MGKSPIKNLKKSSIIAIILVAVVIIAGGSFVSIKILKGGAEEKTGEKSFVETAKEYLKEKLGGQSKTGEKSLTEKFKEEVSKKMMIDNCKKLAKTEDRNTCFTGAAIYYKDQSLCEHIKTREATNVCQENIENYSKAMEERDKALEKLSPEERAQLKKVQESGYMDYLKQIGEKMSDMTKEQRENMSTEEYVKYMEQIYQEIIPGFKSETTTTSGGIEGRGPGGGATEDIYRISEERMKENEPYVREVEALSDDVKVEFTALMQYAMYLYGTEGMWSENAKKAMDRVDEIENENNISGGASQIIMTAVADDPALQSRVEERYNELLKQGLK